MNELNNFIKAINGANDFQVCLFSVNWTKQTVAQYTELCDEYKAARKVIEIYAEAYPGDKYASNWLKNHPIPKGIK